VAKRQVCLDLIVTATSHSVAHEVAVSDQAADNALCRAFCDAHDLSDIAQPQFGIVHDGEQDVGVVRQERPLPVALR
jgi:16S rRNA G527 N7-methylase RsmG